MDLKLNLDKSADELRSDEQTAAKKNRRNTVLLYCVGFLVPVIIVGALAYYNREQQAKYEMQQASNDRMNTGDYTIPAVIEGDYDTYRWTNGKLTYRVNYHFTLDGKTYHGTNDMAREPVSRNQVALYDPENPANNRLRGMADPEQFIQHKPTTQSWDEMGGKMISGWIAMALIGAIRRRRQKPAK